MAIAGVVELILGVMAEGKSLEDIATPLSAQPDGDCLITRCGAVPRPHGVSAISAG